MLANSTAGEAAQPGRGGRPRQLALLLTGALMLPGCDLLKGEDPAPLAPEPAAEQTKQGKGQRGKRRRERQLRRKQRRAALTGKQADREPTAGAQPAAPSKGELVVKVRFHLVKAPGSKWLDTTIGRAKVESLMQEVNKVWAQASVRFELDKVLEEKAINPGAYDSATGRFLSLKRQAKKSGSTTSKQNRKNWSPELLAAKKASSKARSDALPKDQRIGKGIDVFVIGRLPSAGGVFGCGLGGIIYSERRKNGPGGLNIGKVLAHELGHALGLPHTKCASDQNIMMEAGCKERVAANESLNASQIATARQVAATGQARCRGAGEAVED